MLSRRTLVILVTLSVVTTCFKPCVEAQKKSKKGQKKSSVTKTISKKQLESWINQLSKGDFRVRRAASNNLLKAGKQALPVLVKGAQRNDIELSTRCFGIIVKMYHGKDETPYFAAKKALGELENTSYKPIAQQAQKILQQKIQQHVDAIEKIGGEVYLDESGKVQEVDLQGSKFKETVLVPLAKMDSLKKLYLGHSQITDDGLVHLERLNRLQKLSLSNTKVTDAGLVHFKGLTDLQTLELTNTKVTGAELGNLKELQHLVHLSLKGTLVDDSGIVHLKELTKLWLLNLRGTKITDNGLKHLKCMTNLELLFLSATQVTEAGVKELQTALPNCDIYWK